MQPLPPPLQETIVNLLLDDHSIRQVAQMTGVGRSTVGRISKQVIPNKENIPRGRPSKLSSQDKRHLVNKIKSGQIDNAVQGMEFINSINTQPVCAQTVRNALKEHGMKSVVKKKVPLLVQRHRRDRLKWARKYQHWTVEDWKRVIWSDETKILLIGSDGRVYTWKEPGESISDRTTVPTVKHGGGRLMVWGCMGWNGVGVLTEVEGNMNAVQYVEILGGGLEESVEKLGLDLNTFYFQQDNDPKHTAQLTSTWLDQQGFQILDWPAQSPDLNPIEHLWNHVKKQLRQYPRPPSGLHELWDRLVVEWEKIPAEVCQNLISSMPRRCEAVIKAKGAHTKY
jgi:transposase